MRRARQARSRATVSAIVEAATRILARDGWQAVNTNAIAARAGVSVGSVYEYFPNKQAILDVIIDRHLGSGEELIGSSAAALNANITVDAIVRLLVSGFIALHKDDPALHRALAAEVPLSSGQRKRIAGLRNDIIGLVETALNDKVDRPRIKAALLVDTADALAHRWIVDELGTPVAADIMAAELQRMLSLYAADSYSTAKSK